MRGRRWAPTTRYDSLQHPTAVPRNLETRNLQEMPALERQVADKQRRVAELAREVGGENRVLPVLQTGDESEAKSIQGEGILSERFEAELRAVQERLRSLSAGEDASSDGAMLEELQAAIRRR